MKLIQHVWMACIGLCLFSCTQTDELETAQGKTGFIVSLTDGTKLDVSRATPGDIVDSEGIEGADFNLRIVNTETEGEIYNDKVGTEVIKAYSGVYDLTATYGENPVLALDAPYFKGETTGVEVFNDQITQVTIACKVANALVSVTYDNSKALFKDVYSNYYVEVKVGSATPVQIDKTGAKSAYMQAGSAFEVIFHGTPKDANEDKSVVLDTEFGVPATLNAGDHLKLTLSPKLDRFDIPLSIVDVDVVEAPLTEEIPMEWLPKPKVEAEGFTDNELSFVETEQKNAKLNLTLSSALQDIKFKFNFEDEQFAGVLPKEEYLLSNAEDKQAIETALGITLPAIGATEASVDLSDLVGKLQTNAGTTTNNSIMIVPKANNRWSSEKLDVDSVYKFVCNKPEFTIDAYPGNIWTKEFTVNALREEQVTSGNFATLSSNMTYQYSLDGQTNWMTLSDGMRQEQLQPGGTYYIRGLYRGEVPGEATMIQTYPEISLENGGLEDWDQEERGYYFAAFGINAKKLRTYYPWTEKPYWNTNNDYTTRYRDASIASFSTVYLYNSFPAVSYTKDANSGIKAAELRNTAAGRGNKSSSASSYDFNNVPGELFLGDISVFTEGTAANPENDYYNITPGRNFASKPTGLRFYYKYEPYDTDFWKVYIALYDENNNIMAENTVTGSIQESYTFIDVPINYVSDNLNACPTKIYVYFASSIYSGSQLPYHKMNVTTWYEDSQRTDETLSGSVFTVDDISLIYDK